MHRLAKNATRFPPTLFLSTQRILAAWDSGHKLTKRRDRKIGRFLGIEKRSAVFNCRDSLSSVFPRLALMIEARESGFSIQPTQLRQVSTAVV